MEERQMEHEAYEKQYATGWGMFFLSASENKIKRKLV